MAKLFALLFALCVVPSIVTAETEKYLLSGKVVCDHCKVGYETNATTTPMGGAVVNLLCFARNNTSKITHSQQAVTNLQGEYTMEVLDNKCDDVCNVQLAKSGHLNCNITSQGRDQARVILTSNNGMVNNKRFANTMIYEVRTALGNCTKTLQMYQETEDED